MKTHGIKMLTLIFLLSGGIVTYGQESEWEVPGDNFSLEGALELFKKSGSPEEFERMLNSSDSRVNNLDLNGDGDIDYIRVIDRNDGNVHAFILQAVVSPTEGQDVAVIELEKLANGKAVLQITGDADVYGIETIIEPTQEVRVNAGTTTTRTVVNVWAWPSVQYIYSPYYTSLWISPWGWSVRPMWWSPWRPVAYHVYNPWWRPYRPYYSICHTHRVVYAQHIYHPYRRTSVVVHNRHRTHITHYRSKHQQDKNNHYARHTGRSRYDDNRSNGRNNYNRNSSINNSNTYGSSRQPSVSDRKMPTRSSANSNTRSSTNSNNRSMTMNSSSRSTTYNRSGGDNNQLYKKEPIERKSSIKPEEFSSRTRSTSEYRKVTPNSSQRNGIGQQREDLSRKRSSTSTPQNNISRPSVTKPTAPASRSRSGSPTMQRSGNGGHEKSSGNQQRKGRR